MAVLLLSLITFVVMRIGNDPGRIATISSNQLSRLRRRGRGSGRLGSLSPFPVPETPPKRPERPLGKAIVYPGACISGMALYPIADIYYDQKSRNFRDQAQ